MTKIKVNRMALLFTGLIGTCSFAQTSVNASGGNANSAGGDVSYSVGQVVFQNYINSNGSVEQGVQHAYEIVSAGISSYSLNFSVSVYPNPTVDALNLTIDHVKENMEYQLFSENGQLIKQSSINDQVTTIDAQTLAPGLYILNLLSNQEQIESFRIIKK